MRRGDLIMDLHILLLAGARLGIRSIACEFISFMISINYYYFNVAICIAFPEA